ncbi:MAG: 5'/3'-nucleotidase SurE [Prevotella sp.]|nr:5'/3'-nucleotidase SurE [Staphylococcus sp.]MCM1350903.1 5'/3'-nucleotidase SurE [Prevotella sp.]
MNILITNDDGIQSKGLELLVKYIYKYFDIARNQIWIIAPKSEMSAVSHRITLKTGIDIQKNKDLLEGIPTYTVTGTPADCVKVAIHHFSYQPDIVFSGVNKGYNLGNDILYSGTVGATFEASLSGSCGVALSCSCESFDACRYLDILLPYMIENHLLEKNKVLNINIPNHPRAIQFTHQGILPFDSNYVMKDDGLFYLKGHPAVENVINDEYSDVYAIDHQNVSITYLTTNRTDINAYEQKKEKKTELK